MGGEAGLATTTINAAALPEQLDAFGTSMSAKVLAARRVSPEDTPRGGAPDKAPDGGKPDKPDADNQEEDLRFFLGSIVYNEAKERWRSMASAVSDSFEDEFPDWPIEGPRSLFFALLELRLESNHFLEHHQKWVSAAGLHKSERAVPEHEVCCAVLHLGLC